MRFLECQGGGSSCGLDGQGTMMAALTLIGGKVQEGLKVERAGEAPVGERRDPYEPSEVRRAEVRPSVFSLLSSSNSHAPVTPGWFGPGGKITSDHRITFGDM